LRLATPHFALLVTHYLFKSQWNKIYNLTAGANHVSKAPFTPELLICTRDMSKKPACTEHELIQQLRYNKREAFEYLYDNYSPALFGIVYRILKNEEEAADTLQDSFLKIWKNFPSYKSEKGTLFTWMLNIARNSAIDKLRAEARVVSLVRLESVQEIDLTSLGIVNMTHTAADIRILVERLVPERKLLIEMVYFQGYTHEEVSEKLGLPLGTVKSRIRRALGELRVTFEDPQIGLRYA
jgi:RNA polymerase sigma factor (sigma-70 family)